MKATVKDFFGSNLEQEVLDQVVILPFAFRHATTGSIPAPAGMVFQDFEEVRITVGINTNSKVYVETFVSKRLIDGTVNSQEIEWSDPLNTNGYSMKLSKQSDSELRWQSHTTPSNATCYPLEVVGYKRRISRVGIDELMSAMSLPNLIANADLTDNPINQRGFNGNWSSLAVGAYGYDQWMKVSSTHMGYVVEAGKYRPSTKHTLTKDDVVLGEFMSPASGHWIVSVPFATSGKFDLYAGQFKRPWHPVQNGMQRCLRFFEKGKLLITGGGSIAYLTASTQIAPKKAGAIVRVYDNAGNLGKCSFDSTNNIPASATIVNNTSVSCTVSNSVANTNVFADFNWQVESSITLAEVGGQITTVG
ncbi:hypothetical protein AVV30_gp085 [Vibrio phage phi 1]|uniref:Uncharacterized protein n=1 Tax=Vibrio phage phi 1 TaxID=1589297 RepID=A0A0B5H8M6_9CAUD|nr:hypothetical protein AVV30_gp085 [Vibrio phage phi 1]AJF40743.1 hypothetical protein SBVP1_0085 [Vibrio phage phi 1]